MHTLTRTQKNKNKYFLMQNITELYKKPMKNRHRHHHLLATYAKSRQ